jgi:hypothetical protein
MKKILSLALIFMVVLASCKKSGTTNNITIVNSSGIPAFIVSGLANETMVNNATGNVYIPITVQYEDSAQEMVSLAVTGLPAGIVMDTTWQSSGYPTFSTELVLYDTTAAGATPGVYPITLSVTSASRGTKAFTFQLTIKNPPPCTSAVTKNYTNCQNCNYVSFTDSVYADATVENKIWFTNIDNTHNLVYGILHCNTGVVTIPIQTVGGNTYSGSGNFYTYNMNINLLINSSNCYTYVN